MQHSRVTGVPFFVASLLIMVGSTVIHQAFGAPVILGTDIAQEVNESGPVLHFTRPADGWVQPNDTYTTFSIVKLDTDCPGSGYLSVELGVGEDQLIIERLSNGNCIGDEIYIAQLNITFYNNATLTLNGISKKLKDANRSSITVRFVYRRYNSAGDPIEVPSSMAFIHITLSGEESRPNDIEAEDNPLYTTSAQEYTSHTDKDTNLCPQLSNSFSHYVSMEILSFSVVMALFLLKFH